MYPVQLYRNVQELKPIETMPHALVIVVVDQVKAWKTFDEDFEQDVSRVALAYTYYNEKTEILVVTEALKNRLWEIEMDTPTCKKDNFAETIREVRQELNIRGSEKVKIFVSGGFKNESIKELSEAGADGFGVGTWNSDAPVIDFTMDIIEMDGKPAAKRGELGERKQFWRCSKRIIGQVLATSRKISKCPKCGGSTQRLLKPFIRIGRKPKNFRNKRLYSQTNLENDI